jgi:hypothetical protein
MVDQPTPPLRVDPNPGAHAHLPHRPTDGGGQATSSSQTLFGASLEPVLRQACDGHLSPVNWFRTPWQRGGALTGYATFADDAGSHAVVAKLPVAPRERQWLMRLQDRADVAPRLYAHGESLGGYDIAWIVMERLPYGPLGPTWEGREFDLLVEAAGRFYEQTAGVPVDQPPPQRDWGQLFEQARDNLQTHDLADEQRWKNAFKQVHRRLKDWLEIWNARATNSWCHGDLHLANALSRIPSPGGPAVLIDFAEVHPGHWVEDATYFEHLFWARRQRLGGRKLCSQIARERKTRGLPVDPDWPRLASVRRVLLAMSTPALLRYDGDRQHVRAALEVLEHEAASP